jgi:hypothetical protein
LACITMQSELRRYKSESVGFEGMLQVSYLKLYSPEQMTVVALDTLLEGCRSVAASALDPLPALLDLFLSELLGELDVSEFSLETYKTIQRRGESATEVKAVRTKEARTSLRTELVEQPVAFGVPLGVELCPRLALGLVRHHLDLVRLRVHLGSLFELCGERSGSGRYKSAGCG